MAYTWLSRWPLTWQLGACFVVYSLGVLMLSIKYVVGNTSLHPGATQREASHYEDPSALIYSSHEHSHGGGQAVSMLQTQTWTWATYATPRMNERPPISAENHSPFHFQTEDPDSFNSRALETFPESPSIDMMVCADISGTDSSQMSTTLKTLASATTIAATTYAKVHHAKASVAATGMTILTTPTVTAVLEKSTPLDDLTGERLSTQSLQSVVVSRKELEAPPLFSDSTKSLVLSSEESAARMVLLETVKMPQQPDTKSSGPLMPWSPLADLPDSCLNLKKSSVIDTSPVKKFTRKKPQDMESDRLESEIASDVLLSSDSGISSDGLFLSAITTSSASIWVLSVSDPPQVIHPQELDWIKSTVIPSSILVRPTVFVGSGTFISPINSDDTHMSLTDQHSVSISRISVSKMVEDSVSSVLSLTQNKQTPDREAFHPLNVTSTDLFPTGYNETCSQGRDIHIDLEKDSSFETLQFTVPSSSHCSITASAPEGKYVVVRLGYNMTVCVSRQIYIYAQVCDSADYMRLSVGLDRCEIQRAMYISPTNCCKMQVHSTTVKDNVSVMLNFKSHAEKPDINITFMTPKSGYITSPMYDGSDMPLFLLPYNYSAMLQVPPGEAVLLYFEMFDTISPNRLMFYEAYNQTTGAKLLDIYKHYVVPTKVFNTSLYIVYKPTIYQTFGFKLKFEFRSQKEYPPVLDSGYFNCSTQAYKNVKQYLECNVRSECENEEDETDCSFSSANCRSGFDINGKCYKLWLMPHELTWNQAHIQCMSRGGSLMILNSLSELGDIADILLRYNNRIATFIGLKTSSDFSSEYSNILQWLNTRISYDFYVWRQMIIPSCVAVSIDYSVRYSVMQCDRNYTSHIICQFDSEVNATEITTESQNLLPVADIEAMFRAFSDVNVERCLKDHVVLDFVACDPTESCSSDRYVEYCHSSRGGVFPLFVCENGLETVSFTFVCDHHYDCQDKSDESFCIPAPCHGFHCNSGQCVPHAAFCDGTAHCLDKSDEDIYQCMARVSFQQPLHSLSQPSLISLTGTGFFTYKPWNASLPCPSTHFRCPKSHCLPVYLLCNRVEDCPQAEDEASCEDFMCPGFYRCRRSKICLHPQHVCDGIFQCPLHDDEDHCGEQCPPTCRCQGLSFVCEEMFAATKHSGLRYLDAAGSGLTLSHVSSNFLLVYLSLRNCQLREVHDAYLPNLRELDLSHNRLSSLTLDKFDSLRNLKVLWLSWNPMSLSTARSPGHHLVNSALKHLHLSGLAQDEFTVEHLTGYPGIELLNLSHGHLESIGSFSALQNLQVLDMTSSPVTNFPADTFKGLSRLRNIYTDNYKLCCRAILPTHFNTENCHAPQDEISSCDNLLRCDTYRVSLWLLSLIAIVGNGLAFLYRICNYKNRTKTGFGIFVTSLSLADFLMGVYLAVIGVADQVYLGTYSWNDRQWKESNMCKLAGFLSLLSSEVSALTISLITLDRFIVLRFPLSTNHLQKRSATVMCGAVWLIGVTLAAVPFLPATKHWEFYSQNGICLPLPVTRKKFPGQAYAFSIMIVLNFVLFVLIAAGQVAIYCSVRTNSLNNSKRKSKSRDLIIAKRLAVVVMSDFLCWFPIGLLGLLTSVGVPVSGEISVVVGIFVLPFNSAFNPFLYTINTLIERRRERARQKLCTELEMRLRTEITSEQRTRRGKRDSSAGICTISNDRVDLGQILGMIERGSFSQTELELICRKIKIKLSRQQIQTDHWLKFFVLLIFLSVEFGVLPDQHLQFSWKRRGHFWETERNGACTCPFHHYDAVWRWLWKWTWTTKNSEVVRHDVCSVRAITKGLLVVGWLLYVPATG